MKPDLLVTNRRGRGRGRARRIDSMNKPGEDNEQEQDLQDAEQDDPYIAASNINPSNDETKTDNWESSGDAQLPNAKAQQSRFSRRRPSISASVSVAISGENESELVEDDDLVFVLNELGQAFTAQGQYHTAEQYYRHALRISEKHFSFLHSNASQPISASTSPATSSDDISGLLQSSSAIETTAPIPIPRANSPDPLSMSPPTSTNMLTLPQSPSPSFTMAFEFEDKRWRRNLAATLHNLGKLYGEQCMYLIRVVSSVDALN